MDAESKRDMYLRMFTQGTKPVGGFGRDNNEVDDDLNERVVIEDVDAFG